MSGKLVRRESDTKITGVCGAIGNYFGIDPTVVRILFVFASRMIKSRSIRYE